MKIQNIVVGLSILVVSGINATEVKAGVGTWDGNPDVVETYNFNRNIGSPWINDVVVKSGYYNNGTPNTEVTINYLPGTCSAFTDTSFTVTIPDNYDGSSLRLSDSKSTYYEDATSITLSYDALTLSPGTINLKTTTQCTGNTVNDTVNHTVDRVNETVNSVGDNTADIFYDVTDALDPTQWF